MFRNPFSFTGRIRRLEYGLSYIIYIVFYTLGAYATGESEEGGILFLFLFIVFLWFLFAQGTKRCHDLGHSGFYQLIPFYGIWMVFGEGTTGNNKYGVDPKDVKIVKEEKRNFSVKINLPEGKTRLDILNELISVVLLNVLLVVVSYHYLRYYQGLLYLFVFLLTILCFFIFLILNNRGTALPHLRRYLFGLRTSYAVLLYISLRLYAISFLNSEFDRETIFHELLYVGLILGITYLPFLIYPIFFKTNRIDD